MFIDRKLLYIGIILICTFTAINKTAVTLTNIFDKNNLQSDQIIVTHSENKKHSSDLVLELKQLTEEEVIDAEDNNSSSSSSSNIVIIKQPETDIEKLEYVLRNISWNTRDIINKNNTIAICWYGLFREFAIHEEPRMLFLKNVILPLKRANYTIHIGLVLDLLEKRMIVNSIGLKEFFIKNYELFQGIIYKDSFETAIEYLNIKKFPSNMKIKICSESMVKAKNRANYDFLVFSRPDLLFLREFMPEQLQKGYIQSRLAGPLWDSKSTYEECQLPTPTLGEDNFANDHLYICYQKNHTKPFCRKGHSNSTIDNIWAEKFICTVLIDDQFLIVPGYNQNPIVIEALASADNLESLPESYKKPKWWPKKCFSFCSWTHTPPHEKRLFLTLQKTKVPYKNLQVAARLIGFVSHTRSCSRSSERYLPEIYSRIHSKRLCVYYNPYKQECFYPSCIPDGYSLPYSNWTIAEDISYYYNVTITQNGSYTFWKF